MNNFMTTWRRAALAAIALLGLAGAACGGDAEQTNPSPQLSGGGSFAGPVEGTEAFVGLVVNPGDRRVLAYVCDGARLSAWLNGQAAADGTVSLTAKDGTRLAARFDGEELVGTVSPAGEATAHGFTAAAVTAPAGLYRATGEVDGQPAVGGWVVLADGSQRGRVTTSSAGFTSTDTDLARPDKPVTSFTSTDVDF